MAYDVFISYSAQDKPIADAVCAALEARQIRCWIAPRDVLPGQDYAEALIEAINESRAMTLVLSSNSNNSPHVMREVERAASKGIPILPLRIEDVTPSKSMEYFISRTHWLDALTPPLEKHLERLAETLGLLLSGDESAHRVGGGGGELEAPGATATTDVPIQELPHQMEQHIRFCTTSDGVRIAYATVGQGSPLVRISAWLTHLEFEWENPVWRSFIDALSRRFLLIRYDGRGMGLSDRNVKDFSPEAQVLDLEAVLDALGFDRVALYGVSQGGPTAIAYLVRHPERVTHLILYGTYSRYWNLVTEEGRQRLEALATLVRQGWGSALPAYRQLFTSLFLPDADAEATRQFNELQRISTSAENAAALLSSIAEIDVRHLLPQVTAPTLVIHRRGDTIVPFESGRELATGIPGARFLALEGRNHFPLPNEPIMEVASKAIEEFVSGSQRSER
jgi:pimeloyl-ACP methyl ester carboxylesterase